MTSGRYTFEREIGRGASGAVHLGRDTLLGRDVALKRVGYVPGGTSPEEVRAEREARIAASLSHPHLVGVFDLVHVGDSFWLVMEYVEGTSLSALVKDEGALAPDRARRLVGELASALAVVHESGVVHRDVKPSNVLVGAPGTPAETAKLTDFGIARGEDDRALTKTGLVTGSPAYLSPEVVTGGRATQASDVWAIGATLFHLLAGHPPYETSENVLSTMFRIVNEPPPRLQTDPALAEVIEHTLVVDPEQRWSAAQVRDRLLGDSVRRRPPVAPHAAATATQTLPRRSAAGPVGASSPQPSKVPAIARERAAAAAARPLWQWVAVASTVTVLTVGGLALGLRGGDPAESDDTPAARTASSPSRTGAPSTPSRPTDSSQPEPSVSPTPAEPTPSAPTRADVEEFARSYLVAATNDPESAWNRLTPQFQAASGGFDGYVGWWGGVRRAEPLQVTGKADPLRVSYTVRYTLKDGRTSTERVSLQLAEQDGRLLIAGEG